MNVKSKCDSCAMKGYSPELCKLHIRNMAKTFHANAKNLDSSDSCPASPIAKYGKTAAVGAGVGLVAACGSVALIPSVALKALFGHVAVAKVSAGAGGTVAGAGINIARKTKHCEEEELGKPTSKARKQHKNNNKKRRHFYFPLTLTGGNVNG
ncbi:MAG: hypothetical protein HQK64_04400 [Desulfamplus sp.]|nr:hypothetical protein [Desulfamplus sp.]MBF0241702.1 hypothetical protein [Desulfamplus sp.]